MKIYILTIILSIFLFETSYAKNSYFEEGKKLFNNKEYVNSKIYFEKDIVFNPKNKN